MIDMFALHTMRDETIFKVGGQILEAPVDQKSAQ